MYANSMPKSDTDMHSGQHTQQMYMQFVETGLPQKGYEEPLKSAKKGKWIVGNGMAPLAGPKVSRSGRIDTRIIVFQNCSLNMNSKYSRFGMGASDRYTRTLESCRSAENLLTKISKLDTAPEQQSPLNLSIANSFQQPEDNQRIQQLEHSQKLLRVGLLMMQLELNKERKLRAFRSIEWVSKRLQSDTRDDLEPEEVNDIKKYVSLANLDVHEHFMKNLSQKLEIEKQKQDESLSLLKASYIEAYDSAHSLLSKAARLIDRNHRGLLAAAFENLKHQVQVVAHKAIVKQRGVSILAAALSQRLRTNLSEGIREIGLAGQPSQIAQSQPQKLNLTLKQKAKILAFAVKKYPSYNLRRAMWKWHLNTQTGHHHIKKAVDQLVLYTNINLDTAAYRLFRLVRADPPARKVPVKAKRLGLVLFFLTKTAAVRRIRSSFESIRCFEREGRLNIARKLIEASLLCKRNALNRWRDANNRSNRIRVVKQSYLERMMRTRIGKIYMAMQWIKGLPNRLSVTDRNRASKFEKGLTEFALRNIKQTFGQFKWESEAGHVLKKRAATLLTRVTESKLKRQYWMWHEQTKESMLTERCKRLYDLFGRLGNVIKTNSSSVLECNTTVKGNAMRKLQEAWRCNKINLFQRWRQVNAAQGIVESSTNQRKRRGILLLQEAVRLNRADKLKRFVDTLRRISRERAVQKSYLNRFMGGRIGRVKAAYDAILSLPLAPKEVAKAFEFEKKLSSFLGRPARAVWTEFRRLHEQAMVAKERVIELMVSVNTSKTRKLYQRWFTMSNRQKLFKECRMLSGLFSSLNYAVRSVADNVLQDNKARQLKEKGLKQLFENMHSNLRDSFTKWRQNNVVGSLNEKLNHTQRMMLNKMLDPNNVKNFLDHVAELEEFLQLEMFQEDKPLSKLRDKFAVQFRDMIPGFLSVLDGCMKDESVGEALKLLRHLEQLHNCIPEKMQSKDHRRQIKHVEKLIIEKIKRIKEMLRNPKNKENLARLKKFFENPRNSNRTEEEMGQLSAEWERIVTIMADEETILLEEAETHKELEERQEKIEELIRFLPVEQRNSRRMYLTQKQRLLVAKFAEEERRMEEALSDHSLTTKLSFEKIRPQLEFLEKEPNLKILGLIKRLIITSWETLKTSLIADHKSLRQQLRMYSTDIDPFVSAGKSNPLIKDVCCEIIDSFKVAYLEELERHVGQVQIQITQRKYLNTADSRKGAGTVCDNLEELYACLTTENYPDGLYDLKPTLSEAYIHIGMQVIDAYEKIYAKVDVKRMFQGKSDSDSFAVFETLTRIGQATDVLRTQLSNKDSLKVLKGEQAKTLKARVDRCPLSSKLTQQFLEKMRQCEDYLSSFGILDEAFQNADEKELEGSFRQFQNTVAKVKEFNGIFKFLMDRQINCEQADKKMKADIQVVLQESRGIADRLDHEHGQRELKKLNRNTLILDSYEKAFKNESRHGKIIKEAIRRRVKDDQKISLEHIKNCAETFKQFDTKISGLKEREEEEYTKRDQTFEAAHMKKLKQRIEELDRQIAVENDPIRLDTLSKNKQAMLHTQASVLKSKKEEIKLETSAKYAKLIEEVETRCLELINTVAESLTRFKTIEIDLVVARQECQSAIKASLEAYEKYGKRFCNMLANALGEIGATEAELVLKENPKMFGTFNVRRFRDSVPNNGPQHVISRLRSQNLAPSNREDLLNTYKKFQQHYESFTKRYSQMPNSTTLKHLKDTIERKAAETGKEYERKRSPLGYDLLAEIFALWSIMKANVSEEGVEFLYDPHPAQIIAILLVLGLGETKNVGLASRLAEVLTGEGKSIVLAGLSSYLALAGFQVDCMCYSRLLSRRDYDDFKDLFVALGIEDQVNYGTFGQITERLFNSKDNDLRENVKQIYLQDKDCSKTISSSKSINLFSPNSRKRILLVDEVDVFFGKEFFGKFYSPSTSIKGPLIENLVTYVWNNRGNITFRQLVDSEEFRKCLQEYPYLQTILRQSAVDMIGSVRNFKHDYIIHEGKIGYVLPEGISSKASYGWKTIFAYYYEAERGALKTRPEDSADISILCCEMSYAELPRSFDYIMGVTGTLEILADCQKKVLKDWYGINSFYYMPSVYGDNRRTKLGARIFKEAEHAGEICKSIENQTKLRRPVVVFFQTIDKMNDFYLSTEFKHLRENAMTISEKNDPSAVKDRVVQATRPGNITLLSRAFGRGTDFVISDKRVKEAGGLHVIQTFISEEESEDVQIEGRTARQGQVGTYEMILSEESLNGNFLTMADVIGMNPIGAAERIRTKRNGYFEATYVDQIKAAEECRTSHSIAKRILEYIEKGSNDRVREEVDRLNRSDVRLTEEGRSIRTVIGIDATSSMSRVISQVLQNIKTCLTRTCLMLDESKIKSGFEIQLAVYRNYGSGAELLFQSSPFSNNAADLITFLSGIEASGGQGRQAIEVLYNHILNVEANVDQLIVIGDAPGNTMSNIISNRRPQKEATYWSNTKYSKMLDPDQLIQGLVVRRIPVHSFYISKGTNNVKSYFKQISTQTQGQCSEYPCEDINAADLLTNFIVENVLNKIGGADLVKAYRIRFKA